MPLTMTTNVTAITTYASVMWDTTGIVGRWTGQVTRTMVRTVKSVTPQGTRVKWNENEDPHGSLVNSIKGSSTRFSPVGREIVISANTYYAYWVHEGTKYITPQNGEWLHLPPNVVGGKPMGVPNGSLFRAVRGQTGNPYLKNGYELCQKIYPQLPPNL